MDSINLTKSVKFRPELKKKQRDVIPGKFNVISIGKKQIVKSLLPIPAWNIELDKFFVNYSLDL